MEIQIKLEAYLQQFLTHKLNGNNSASYLNIVGALIKPYLQLQPNDFIPRRETSHEYYTINLLHLHDVNTNHRYFMSECAQRDFERVLSLYFWDIFFTYMDDKVRYMNGINDCIVQFFSDHNIAYTDNVYEMIKKRYYRRRKNMGFILPKGRPTNKKISLQNVPFLSLKFQTV